MLNVKIGFTSEVNAGEHPDRRPARRRADCNSLEAWLDRIERIHPKSIAMGLDRVVVFGSFHTVAAAMTVHRDEALRVE